jgi:hypothetical protein
VIQRPPGVGAFQFVILASLRTAQLIRGCRPRVGGTHKKTITAQFEVAAGLVTQLHESPPAVCAPARAHDAPVEEFEAMAMSR